MILATLKDSMLAPITHILPFTIVQRERLLPTAGKVTVRKGQKVNPADVVAEANLSPEHLALSIARGLGLPPAKADACVTRKVGEEVEEGDILAGPVGLAKRVVRAPRPGKIAAIGNGRVLLEVNSSPFELRAGLPGSIASIAPERGVVVENTGALIQGVWGNGKIDLGPLHILLRKPDDALTADMLDVSMRGAVVLGGHCREAAVLQTAAEMPLRGLILASMASAWVPAAASAPFPIIVLEGFGPLPLNSVAFKLLTTSGRRDTAINAEMDVWRGLRPEVFIPLPAAGNLPQPNETAVFSPNQRVRVFCAPYRSQIGVLVALRAGLHTFPNGIRAPAAEVRLESGENSVLPLANLEILD